MKIYFLETEPEEQECFQETLSAHDLHFVDSLSDVARDAEIVSGFIQSRIDDAFVEDHPAVKLIATRSTTHDHIDIGSRAKRHVTACKVESYGDTIVAGGQGDQRDFARFPRARHDIASGGDKCFAAASRV